MRIQQPLHNTTIEQSRRENSLNNNNNSTKFSDLVHNKKYEIHQKNIHYLMSKIDEQGKVLAEKRTISHLTEYKKSIRELIREVVSNGYELQEKQGMHPNGRRKNYKIVQEIDKKLVELTNEVTNKEQSSINILNIVGSLKGLLIDITT